MRFQHLRTTSVLRQQRDERSMHDRERTATHIKPTRLRSRCRAPGKMRVESETESTLLVECGVSGAGEHARQLLVT